MDTTTGHTHHLVQQVVIVMCVFVNIIITYFQSIMLIADANTNKMVPIGESSQCSVQANYH